MADVAAMVARLAAPDAEIIDPPTILIPGGPHIAFAKNLSGCTIELIQTSRK